VVHSTRVDSGDTIGQLIDRGHSSGAAGLGTAASRCTSRCTPVRCVPARRATPIRYRYLRYTFYEIYDLIRCSPVRCRPIKSRRLRCIPAKKTHPEMHAYEVHALISCAYFIRYIPPIWACEIHAFIRYMPVRYINKKYPRERCMPNERYIPASDTRPRKIRVSRRYVYHKCDSRRAYSLAGTYFIDVYLKITVPKPAAPELRDDFR
jgi:hypothetical protein